MAGLVLTVDPARGILLKLAATLAFALMNAVVKSLGHLPLGEIVFFRAFFALVPVFIVAGLAGRLSLAFRTQRPHLHVVRSLVGTAAMFCYFVSITSLPLADSTAFGFVAPIFAVVLAALMLKEKVGPWRWGAVVAGFLGVLLMIEPHGGIASLFAGGLSTGAAFGIAGAFLAAFVVVFIRQMSATERSEAIVFYFMVTCSALSAVTLLFEAVVPSAWDLALLVASGLLGGIGQLCMTFSYRHAEPSLLAPFDYVMIVWASALGAVVFGEWPEPVVLAGCGVVIAAGLFIAWRERIRGQQTPKVQSL